MPFRELAIRISLALFTVFLLVVGIEAGLRIFDVPSQYFSFHRYDKETNLRTLRPNYEARFVSECFDQTIKTNSQGFHDKEFDKEKEKEEFRVAVLGDSFVEARTTPLEDTFHKILEDKLNENFERKFSVYSFGVAGISTIHNFLNFKKYAEEYNPDLVINMFFDNNDLQNDWGFAKFYGLPDGNIDEYINKTFHDRTLISSLVNSLSRKFRSVDFLNKYYSFITKSNRSYYKPEGLSDIGNDKGLPASVTGVVTEDDMWSVQEKIFNIFNEEVKGSGAKFMVVSFNSENYEKEEPAKFEHIPERMRGVLSGDVHYLPLEPKMRSRAIKGGRSPFFSCNPHWSEVGHSWAADEIYEYLSENSGDLGIK